MSYSLGTEYGYDQVHVDANDFRNFLSSTDANTLHTIPSIDNRENRILRKINQFRPSCQENRDRNSIDYCPPNLYSPAGESIESDRMKMRKNIEDYYFSGREHRIGDCRQPEQPKQSKQPSLVKEGMSTTNGGDDIRTRTELEKQNNLLVLFAVCLLIIILVQYSKLHNDPRTQIMLVPSMQQTEQQASAPPPDTITPQT
jgi:hypothetical protein